MSKKKVNHVNLAESLVEALNKYEVGAYIYHKATTGSVYIRFGDAKLCSVRVGDHDGREKYKYKFNLRSDIKQARWDIEDNIWRYYCPCHRQDLLIEEVLKRKEFSKDWETKYEYKTPSFRKFEAK